MKVIDIFEKLAIKHLLEKKVNKIKLPEEWLAKIWKSHSEEIFKMVVLAIDKAIDKVIEKALKDMKIDVGKKK